MAEKRLAKNSGVVWMNADHPHADKNGGPGWYEVLQDAEHEEVDFGNRKATILTNPVAKFGKKLEWRKDKPDPEGQPANSENNEGYFIYADSVEGSE